MHPDPPPPTLRPHQRPRLRGDGSCSALHHAGGTLLAFASWLCKPESYQSPHVDVNFSISCARSGPPPRITLCLQATLLQDSQGCVAKDNFTRWVSWKVLVKPGTRFRDLLRLFGGYYPTASTQEKGLYIFTLLEKYREMFPSVSLPR